MTSQDLKGRHALITGGARGLGEVMARAYAQEGAHVTITAARSSEELDATVHSIGAHVCHGVLADVCDQKACERTVEEAEARFGPIDVLINNAGRGPGEMTAPEGQFGAPDVWSFDPQAFETIVRTNILGVYQLTRLIAPAMVERGWGRIINISTSRSTMLLTLGGAYGPSKAALETMTAIWAKHLSGTGVTANVLLPGGGTDTPFIPGGEPGARPTVDWRAHKGQLKEGDPGGLLPAEVMAAPALWLGTEASSRITGRRFVGANWMPDVPAEEALKHAMGAPIEAPHIL